MRALLDSHAFLWFILDDRRLSEGARDCIGDATNGILVSPATLWEIAIMIRLGKYALPEAYEPFIEAQFAVNEFSLLPIVPRHTALLTTLPLHHRDPFDRLIVAQSLAEAIPLIGTDATLDAYGIQRIW
jgi:PIN domain nuclease of toxin-antitoxin system